jgi:hypothetical protein
MHEFTPKHKHLTSSTYPESFSLPMILQCLLIPEHHQRIENEDETPSRSFELGLADFTFAISFPFFVRGKHQEPRVSRARGRRRPLGASPSGSPGKSVPRGPIINSFGRASTGSKGPVGQMRVRSLIAALTSVTSLETASRQTSVVVTSEICLTPTTGHLMRR